MLLRNKILLNASFHPKLRFIHIPFSVREKIYEYYRKKYRQFNKLELNKTNDKILSNLKIEGTSPFKVIDKDIVEDAVKKIDTLKPKISLNGKIYFKHEDLFSAGILNDVYLDIDLLQIIEKYFGCAPKIQYLAAWKVKEGVETNEMYFHPDRHGHKFIKFFIYLTDVDENDGHHEMIPMSQQSRFEEFIKNVPIDQRKPIVEKSRKGWFKKIKLENSLFEKSNLSIKKIFGKKGTSFLEDTSCFHRGTQVLPNCNERIIFQILFTPWDNQKDKVVKIPQPNWVKNYQKRPEVKYALKNIIC
jgi:hypothetical protein